MKHAWLPILSAGAMALATLPASAQMVVSAKSGVVNFAEGSVLLDDKAVESSLTKYPEIKENSILRTEAGRAEVLLTPGTVMRMGESAGLKMISNRLIDTRVLLQSGSAVVETVQTAKDNSVTVAVQNGAATVAKAGIYRFDASPARLKVFHGEAAVEINGQTTLVGSGRMMMLDGSSLAVEKFNVEDTDALDHWSKQRGQLLAMANPSTAKSFTSNGYGYGSGYGYGGIGCMPYWGFNTWYGMYTYVPCNGYFRDPYGFNYWSPRTVGGLYYHPPVFRGGGGGYGNGGFGTGGYTSMGVNSGGYSSSMSSMGSTASAGSSMGSSIGSSGSTAAASGGGSVGHGGGTAGGGSGGGGGHGH